MQDLLDRAGLQKGNTSPNPVTAAAIVRDEKVVAIGVHERAGKPHAEVEAIRQAGDLCEGADLYVNLEPCTHHGRTGPCTEAIVAAGIKRVIFAVSDPNPEVRKNPAGPILAASGIAVQEGLLADQAMCLNEVFFKNVVAQLPFVTLKVGMSLDGRIAMSSGESKYITGEASRQRVHEMRHQADALIVGVDTILADDPRLNVRFENREVAGRDPVAVILDVSGKTPGSARVFDALPDGNVVIVTGPDVALEKVSEWPSHVTVLALPVKNGHFDWKALLKVLYARGLGHIILEGGSGVYSSALASGVVDKLAVFIAPLIIGEAKAKPWVALSSVTRLDEALKIADMTGDRCGNDLVISGYLQHPKQWFG